MMTFHDTLDVRTELPLVEGERLTSMAGEPFFCKSAFLWLMM